MNFRQFVEDADTWNAFKNAFFINEFEGQASDFQCWLRRYDLSPIDYSYEDLIRLFNDWKKSKRRGKWCDILDRKRRRDFGPGRFWAPASAGVHLNKNFVKGWRGINPVNP